MTSAASSLRALARYIHGASWDDLPGSVVESARLRLLDFLGTALHATSWAPLAAHLKLLETYGDRPEATVIGAGVKRPCAVAAMLNSYPTLSDGSRFARGHCAWIAMPAALAVAELRTARAEAEGRPPVHGRDLLLAIVLAYEVMLRVGEALHPQVHDKGFQTTTVRGPLGAAAAASRLLGLDEKATAHALAIASAMGTGLFAGITPWPVYWLQMGKATEAGVLAALAAEAGIQGNEALLEEGFLPTFGGPESAAGLAAGLEDLGRRFAIESTYLKLHFGCRHTHPPADTCLDLVRAHGLGWEEIAAMRVHVYPAAFEECGRTPARTAAEAMYDIHAVVAMAAIFGDAGPTRFKDKVIQGEPMQQVMGRTTLIADPELDREYPRLWPSVVEVETRDGRRLRHRRDLPKGEPEDPYPRPVIEAKFDLLASRAIDEPARRGLLDFINSLERRERAADLAPLLASRREP
jgi:2-methylcitrate dehydratase PrpD